MKSKDAAGQPDFRRYGQGDSFRYPQLRPEHVEAVNGRIFLPKVGWCRYRDSRRPQGKIKQITVSQDAGRWFVSLTMALDKCQPCAGEVVAANRGVTDTLARSDGRRVEPLNAHKKAQYRLRRYQRSVCRKIEAQKRHMSLDPEAPFPKGIRLAKSNRQRWPESRVAKCHRKIALQRKDWAHKLTTRIVDESAIVVLEDLKIRNMTASAKGHANTWQASGSEIGAYRVLNRSILDQAWYQIEQMLCYKTAWRGGEVLEVPAPYTSQRCSVYACVTPFG